ncbi:MAG: flagellar assembly protein FliW [Actinomycetota bacterium]
MKLETRRFGNIDVDEDEAFDLKAGIPGFPEMRHVVLLDAGAVPGEGGAEPGQAMFWLQDLDDGDLAFLCIVPWVAFPDYDFEIDQRSLGISDDSDLRVLTIVTARHEDGAARMTTNLRAPLVIDTNRRQLQQVILSDSRWPIRAPFAEPASARAPTRHNGTVQ